MVHSEKGGKNLGVGFAFGILFTLGLVFAAYGVGLKQSSATVGGGVLLALSLAGIWNAAKNKSS